MSYTKTISVQASAGGASTSSVVPLDIWLGAPVLLGCVVSGTITYTVQHTFDNVLASGTANATWFNHDNAVLVSATGNAEDNFIAAPRAVRLLAHTGNTGEVKMTIIQTGGYPT